MGGLRDKLRKKLGREPTKEERDAARLLRDERRRARAAGENEAAAAPAPTAAPAAAAAQAAAPMASIPTAVAQASIPAPAAQQGTAPDLNSIVDFVSDILQTTDLSSLTKRSIRERLAAEASTREQCFLADLLYLPLQKQRHLSKSKYRREFLRGYL